MESLLLDNFINGESKICAAGFNAVLATHPAEGLRGRVEDKRGGIFTSKASNDPLVDIESTMDINGEKITIKISLKYSMTKATKYIKSIDSSWSSLIGNLNLEERIYWGLTRLLTYSTMIEKDIQ